MMYLCVVCPAFVSFKSFTYTSEAGPGSLLARRIYRQQQSAQCRIDGTHTPETATDRRRRRQKDRRDRRRNKGQIEKDPTPPPTRHDKTRFITMVPTTLDNQASRTRANKKPKLKLSPRLSCLTLSLCPLSRLGIVQHSTASSFFLSLSSSLSSLLAY